MYNFPQKESVMKGNPVFLLLTLILMSLYGGATMAQPEGPEIIQLPDPILESDLSFEEILAARRSVREYGDRSLTIDEISQLSWAAQGITADWGARTAPSAGGLFPVRIFIIARDIDGITDGSWEYDPHDHSLTSVKTGDLSAELQSAALDQESIGNGQAVIAITAIPSIIEARYGDRSMRYIDTETGAVCQNIYLMCENLDLGTVAVGAFHDEQVAEIIGTTNDVRLLMPIGPIA